MTIVFDDTAKTLSAQNGSQKFSFASASISNVVINGVNDSISVGIDRSSLGIVWQTYGPGNVVIEYGRCQRSNHPGTASTY